MAEDVNLSPNESREFLFTADRQEGQRTIVQTHDVRKVYRMGRIEVQALRGVSISIFESEFLAIMGPSGSGKSTFFNMIGGLDKPSGGKVYIDEVDIAQLDAFELAWLRCRKIGYIFQSFNLIPVMTCLENVMLPMTFAGVPNDDAMEQAIGILKQVGLGHRLTHKPPQMSGGQQQRIAVARALANRPAIILADEPTANLDMKTGQEIIDLLVGLCHDLRVTVICATHDMKMLDKCDRVVWIRDGLCDRIEDRANIDIQVGALTHE
ncbi:MAG: ABC transporter ATP-binding protein [Lentisphaerae bacterium]|nr:ABC transporter ATP-binding protein [Lentisphaerota bacterium]